MDFNQLNSLFRLHIIPEGSKFHSRANFFGITREKNETAEDVWTRILQVEKNCELENATPGELIASKLPSLSGRSTGDYEIKKKIRKSDMTIETITNLIHKYMYDRLNEWNNSYDEKEIQHIQKWEYKRKWSEKSSYGRPRKNRTVKNQYIKTTGADNVVHLIGQECTTSQQNPQNVVFAKGGDITTRCADDWRKTTFWKKVIIGSRRQLGSQ